MRSRRQPGTTPTPTAELKEQSCFFSRKVRTLLSSKIRSETFQRQLKTLWTFAAQHVGEIHRRDVLGLEPCKFEFGQRILTRVKEPKTKFEPRLQAAVFLGFAPGVTNGFYVMRGDGTIELTSNITEDTMLDEPEPVLKDDVVPGQASNEQEIDDVDKTPEQRMMDAIMGFAGGVGWQDEDSTQTVFNTGPLEDPFTELSIKAIAKRIKAKMDDVLWEKEDLKPEEIPEQFKEIGAIIVSMKDIKNSIGKQRENWRISMLKELHSLYVKDAVHAVHHVPKGAKVLPMKAVATLKTVINSLLRKDKFRACVCGNFLPEDHSD